jgi:hypothetical protein
MSVIPRSLLTRLGELLGGRDLRGRGGPTGTPSHDLDEAPPSVDQEANSAVSGGGIRGPGGRAPARHARRSR